MKRESKTGEIESRLERSLRKQVRAPKLDGRFDAGVWSRIEASAAPAATSRRTLMPRWLIASHVLGVLVALARFNAGLLGTLHQAQVHENERSGAAWTLEWMVLPQMAIAAAAGLQKAKALIAGAQFAASA